MLTLVFSVSLVNVSEIHAASPIVTVTSVYNVKETGVTFLVNITVTDASDLFMWVINLRWDPDMVKISTGDTRGLSDKGIYYNIYEGPFLKSIRSTVFLANDIDNTEGNITALTAGYLTPGSTGSGNGILATINFTSIDVGTTTMEIIGPSSAYAGQSMLIDHTGKEMSHEDVDGVVSERGPPPPPPFWTQLWFQVAVPVIVVAVVLGYVVIKVVMPARERREAEEEEMVE